MQLRFIDPQQIMGAVLALLILGIGVFASFTVFANIPTTEPQCNAVRDGNGSLYSAAPLGVISNTTDPILRYIPAPGFLNNTGVCILYAEGAAGISGGFDNMYVLQTVGSCNGTFMTNGTYRTGHDWGVRNTTIYLHYTTAAAVTDTLENSTYTAIINVSGTSTTVFNIIGVVLVLAAIMSIVGLIYTYIRPRM